MAVAWSAPQREVVAGVLGEFGLESGRCERAASRILPPAREVDQNATARRCLPLFGRYVSPKHKWFYHVNVLVASHYVDALCGPDGLDEDEYMLTHWPDRSAVDWHDLSDEEVEGLAGWTS